MLTLQDLCIHTCFRSINLNGFHESEEEKEIFSELCKHTRYRPLPPNIFVRILNTVSHRLHHKLALPYFFSYLGGTTHLDLRLMKKLTEKWDSISQIPTLFALMHRSAENGKPKPLRVLRLPNFGVNPPPWEEIKKIIFEHPHLEFLRLPLKSILDLGTLIEIAIDTKAKREEKKLIHLSFQTSFRLQTSSMPLFEQLLKKLEDAKVSPETFQIAIHVDYNVAGDPALIYHYTLDRIYGNPYIHKYGDQESTLFNCADLFSTEQKSRTIFKYPKDLTDTNLPSFLSIIKECLQNNSPHQNNFKSRDLIPSDSIDTPSQKSLEFFRMSFISSLTIKSHPEFTQADLNTILSLNLHRLTLDDLNNIELIKSNTITKLDCSDCDNLQFIQLPYAKFVSVDDCPLLIQLSVPNVITVSVDSCDSLTEFINTSAASVGFFYCNSLTHVDVSGAAVCHFRSCLALQVISARSAHSCNAEFLTSLTVLNVDFTKKLIIEKCSSLKTIKAPYATKLSFEACQSLDYVDAPRHTRISKKAGVGQTHFIQPKIKYLNLPLFQGKLFRGDIRRFNYFNAPHASFELFDTNSPTPVPIQKRSLYKTVTIHLVAVAMLATLGVLFSYLLVKQEDLEG